MAHPDTILIVDDHPDIRDGMRHMLETEGYAVHTASNGREALALLFGGLQPCVIVMDLAMPVMNGFEFRQEQLKHPEIADIPFIAYSAVVDVHRNAQHLRAAAYLEKPIEFQHVLSIIRQHCER
jgi:CheY-like chemotaxis protein